LRANSLVALPQAEWLEDCEEWERLVLESVANNMKEEKLTQKHIKADADHVAVSNCEFAQKLHVGCWVDLRQMVSPKS
jgi:uncharacterized protein YebE (UPF0316 family)